MERRQLIGGATALALAAARPARAADEAPFDGQTVRAIARKLAAEPYKAPDLKLPPPFDKLGYDAWRATRFDPNQALWRGQNLPFNAQFFHRGWLYPARVDIHEVTAGRARPLAYRPEMFTYPPDVTLPESPELGFAGFRLHAAINRPDYLDEVAVFLGASYFRGVGRNLLYGLSARGLALNTADPAGEEFPAFRAFWIERPQPGTNSIVVHGLIDSPSTAAAMRISIRPGEDTVMDVELTLFPRVDLLQPGIAAGTSMFLFDASNRTAVDDWRAAVHDSDGLMMLTGRSEALWRPLANPRTLQVSSFMDSSPRGFGLMQRKRALEDFADLEARYDRRPGLWVEPIGDWGEGAVTLVEIPTRQEIHDNIVAFWRPKNPLRAKAEHGFTYRLHWCAEPPLKPDLARFGMTRTGAIDKGRVFVLEVGGPKLKGVDTVQPRVTANKGAIQNVAATQAPGTDAWRLSFEMLPGDERLVELRALLLQGDTPLTETWVYRWTS